MEYYIIDTLTDEHIDNTRRYTIENAIEFAKELIEIEKQSYDGEDCWKDEKPCKDNVAKCLEHFCYRMVEGE